MPSGAAVVRYDGKRGAVWRIKYTDASGKQVMETIGAERDGVTRKQAEAALRHRLVNVEQRGWRKPAPRTFTSYAETWFAEGQTRRGWKPRTIRAYGNALDRLIADDRLGNLRLGAIRPRDVAEYVRSDDREP